jgi:pilus assembly protein CpaB
VFRRKLPRSSFVLLSVSVACALAAAIVMRAYAHRLDVVRPDGGPPIAVVAAAAHVPRGSVLTETVLEVVTLPSRFAPPGAIRDVARAAGRVAVADIAAGEVVTQLRLAGSRSGPTASLVRAGMRAVEVPVASTVGVRPGDLVDVIAIFGGGGAHTEVAGEAIEVLAVSRAGGGASFGAGPAGSSGGVGLVLLVTPTDAERLAFASSFATLSIAVRGPDDLVTTPAFTVPVTGAR